MTTFYVKLPGASELGISLVYIARRDTTGHEEACLLREGPILRLV